MRRMLSGLALALVAMTTITGQAHAEPTTTAQQVAYMERTAISAMWHKDGQGFQFITTDLAYHRVKPVGVLLRACKGKPAACRRHVWAQHYYLTTTFHERHRVFVALRDALPACSGPHDTSQDCYFGGDSTDALKFLILGGIDYHDSARPGSA